MSKTVGTAITLLAMLSWPAGCGDGDTGSADPAPASASASALTISCTDDTTAVDQTSVSAGATGLAVRVVDDSTVGLVALMESETTAVAAYVEADDVTVEVAPGGYAVRCVDLDEPEHMEPATGNPESQHVEVLASSDIWTPQRDPSCDERTSSVRDYAAMPEPDPRLRAEPVEPVVRNDLSHPGSRAVRVRW